MPVIVLGSGNKKEVKDGLTLPELIELEKVETPLYVTVSINEEFIQKDAEDVLDPVRKIIQERHSYPKKL